MLRRLFRHALRAISRAGETRSRPQHRSVRKTNHTNRRHTKRTVSQKHKRYKNKKSAKRSSKRRPNFNSIIAYHGTQDKGNVRSIFRDGWMVGEGNALGDGIYFAKDISTAKSYAGPGGIYIKCLVRLGRTCQWNSDTQRRFNAWCKRKAVVSDNSAKTAFLIQNGYNTVRDGNVIVVLAPLYANCTAWKRKNRRIRILSVHRGSDGRRIRV